MGAIRWRRTSEDRSEAAVNGKLLTVDLNYEDGNWTWGIDEPDYPFEDGWATIVWGFASTESEARREAELQMAKMEGVVWTTTIRGRP